VGNADGKSPPGQSKGNKEKGYECDGNKGIGKGNPAHTGCTTTTTTTTTTTDNTTPTTSTTTPTTSSTTPSTQVLGETISRAPTQVLGATATRGALARTGTDPRGLTLVGLGLVLLGAALVRRTRMGPTTA
jgi:LPXTG-motif cell wall-anchored protein